MATQAHLLYPENFDIFRDAVSNALIEKISTPSSSSKKVKSKSRSKRATIETATATATATTTTTTSSTGKDRTIAPSTTQEGEESQQTQAEDLADFTTYIAELAFQHLPPELQSLTHRVWSDTPSLQETYTLPFTTTDAIVTDDIIPLQDPTLSDSLVAYSILTPPLTDLTTFLTPILTFYLTTITAAPPPPSSTRPPSNECEICGRDWVPLTYHHLIPKMVHAKAVKRGWHREEDLGNVAWLCRACHSFVHRFKGNEELARGYFTVERLLGEEEVRKFAGWVARVRWKSR